MTELQLINLETVHLMLKLTMKLVFNFILRQQ